MEGVVFFVDSYADESFLVVCLHTVNGRRFGFMISDGPFEVVWLLAREAYERLKARLATETLDVSNKQ